MYIISFILPTTIWDKHYIYIYLTAEETETQNHLSNNPRDQGSKPGWLYLHSWPPHYIVFNLQLNICWTFFSPPDILSFSQMQLVSNKIHHFLSNHCLSITFPFYWSYLLSWLFFNLWLEISGSFRSLPLISHCHARGLLLDLDRVIASRLVFLTLAHPAYHLLLNPKMSFSTVTPLVNNFQLPAGEGPCAWTWPSRPPVAWSHHPPPALSMLYAFSPLDFSSWSFFSMSFPSLSLPIECQLSKI